ncbi:Mannosyl-glycoprotein endo-beta-N-acetylglucosaminidase [Lactiplantibacillus plantarum subsp. plantarum]|uniref:Mannosyl-glycoprotein endo-beta-N-acetylglucosaminidase n=1 Tax=Lactiplantibacillus plantarum subsp. plantarum TaxID=337330 RepID=A0A2S3U945_LACPN|nr:Mannosyl-glycoprotein endo-beta-N-acetylglucosaminidase [Lactiplantibacillus plantarum subsp. plantarum]
MCDRTTGQAHRQVAAPDRQQTQDPKMKVVALSIMNASTSGNAPRGINTFDANVFSKLAIY